MIQADSVEKQRRVQFTNGKDIAFCDMESGFTPHDLLEAAVAACVNLTIRKVARENSLAHIGVSVTVHVDRNETGEAIYESSIKLSGDLSDEQTEKLLDAAHACAVRETLLCKASFSVRNISKLDAPYASACPLTGCG